MPTTIVPLTDVLIPDAAKLLARRHQRDCLEYPMLPARFEDAGAAQSAVTAVWKRAGASGVALMRNNELRGYLIGDTLDDSLWGRCAWVRLAGCALAADENIEATRDLYAALAAPWVKDGYFFHFVVTPVADRAMVHAWCTLSFGIQQIHALRDLEDCAAPAPVPGIEIRRAEPGDRETLEEFSELIWQYQVQAPVWGITLPERRISLRKDYGNLVTDAEATIWLAFADGQPVGFHAYFAVEVAADDLLTPDQCVELSVAATVPTARGRGIGQALTQYGLAQAQAAGYRYCLTDWRSTNLLSSRFWPRRGFQPVAYRLVQRIDPRISWAGVP